MSPAALRCADLPYALTPIPLAAKDKSDAGTAVAAGLRVTGRMDVVRVVRRATGRHVPIRCRKDAARADLQSTVARPLPALNRLRLSTQPATALDAFTLPAQILR
jgi:hypothetical protein